MICTFCSKNQHEYCVDATISKKDLGRIQRTFITLYVCADCNKVIKKLKWKDIILNTLFTIESIKNYIEFKETTEPDKLPNPKITQLDQKRLTDFGGAHL